MTNSQFSDLSFNNANSSGISSYLYTYVTSPFTDENGDLYPLSQNPDWNPLLNWMNQTDLDSKPPSLNEFIYDSSYSYTHITPPFTNENGYLYPTPQNQDWVSLLNWVNQIEPYQKPPDPVSLYDFVVVGGGASGIMTSYKIATENPDKTILLLESNPNTLDDYKNSGYDNIFQWRNAQQDDNYQYAFVGENNETIWLGKGLGGGTLHFGLQYIDQTDLINAQFQEDISIYQNIANITNAQKYNYNNTNGVKTPNTAYYDLKESIEASSNNLGMNFYNNKVYSTDLQTNNRLLLGDLLQDLSNVTILYDQKISNIEFYDDAATNVINFNNEKYYGKQFIMCAGAIQTPAILQRSGIDCGNKLYDHGGFTITYGKLQPQETTTTQPYSGNGDFQLNTTNLEKINTHSGRNVYYVTGSGVNSSDVNKVYDFTNWASSHPGGSYAITKWSTDYNLRYPHSSSRWNSYKSNFIEVGTYEGTINYANLPENLKSQALYDALFPDETITTTTYVPVDLGFESQNIVSHVQTRDTNLNWQTYYSIIPGLENTLILTHALSNSLTGLGSVKINSSDDVNPDVTINYLGNNESTYIDYLEEAFTKNHQLLTQQGYTLLQPAYSNLDTSEKIRAYIVSQINSIYHYHGSCAIGDVVDNNQKLYNKSNVYIGDISVLNKPWSGSTSVAALASGYKCALNFTNTTPETVNSFYISNMGMDLDSTTGSLNDPFNTINFALSKITNQTKLQLREGSYEFLETDVSDPIEITSYNNENVVFDGTRSIEDLKDNSSEGNWTPVNRTIVTDNNQQKTVTQYKIKLRNDVEIWQLFYNREEVINARWPSAQWTNDEVYDLNNWGHGYYNYSDVENTVKDYTNGEIVDISHNDVCLYSFIKQQKLIDSNFTITDSLINLNIGSFKSYTKEVTNTIVDDTNSYVRLSYDPVSLYKEKHHYYYLENKLEYLNSQNEWYFDNTSKYLYVWLPNNSLPTTENIRAKVQSYSLNLKSDNITLSKINFFSTTFKSSGKDGIIIDNCNFLYPSCYAHMLKQINYGSTFNPQQNETFISQTYMSNCSNCTIKNSVFKYTDGSVLEVGGTGNTLNNNYFSYIDKTVCNLSSVMTAIRYNGSNHTIKYNTIHKTAASSTLNPGNNPIIEYNNLYNSGYLQSDGAMIHLMVNQQVNSKIRFNWVHDTIKYGIRFDGDGDGHDGYIHHNIGWNCNGGIMAKGGILDSNGNSVGGHYVYNNTFFDSHGKNDLMILNTQAGKNINYGSLVLNNLAETISGHRSDAESFANQITSLNNFSPSNLKEYLKNSAYHDYRPINDSSIVNSGLSTHTATGFNPSGVDILTTDIGAMRFSDSKWKAGITWNKSIYSDEEYVSKFKLKFYDDPEPQPEPEPEPEIIQQSEPEPSIQKILCLHGGGDSVSGFSNQTGMQNMISDLDGEYTFDFLSASGNDMMNAVWWNDAPTDGNNKGTTTDENWAQTTINKINNKINSDGPYHAILGYSQGAAACIVWDAFNRESASPLSISKVLLFCGYLPENHTGLLNVIDRNSPSDTRTLIFIGDQDTNFRGLGLEIKNKFNNYLELIDTNVGHYVPMRTDETYSSVLSFIRENTETFITQELINQYANLSMSEKTNMQISGTVQYINLEGGFYGLVNENGTNYLPINIQNELVNYVNQNIHIDGYIQKDAVSIFMWGELFYSTNIIEPEAEPEPEPQTDTSDYEKYSTFFVNNYNYLSSNGSIQQLTIDSNNVEMTNMLTSITEDTTNNNLVLTGNGIPNYIPKIMGFDVTGGWNEIANGNNFQGLKFSEEDQGSSGANNPGGISASTETFTIPLTPQIASTPSDTALGTVGVSLNGIPIYNPFEDQNESSAYGRIFSGCCGHPQRDGFYHYHKYPTCLKLLNNVWKSEKDKCDEIDQLIENNGHSPLIGFCLDGFPVYGPVGYDANGESKIMRSSYTGTVNSAGNPTYVENSGDLDECNGIIGATPEFPNGIFHYHMTIKSENNNGIKVSRYINPHFGYDIRSTLQKHSVMPESWSNDESYYTALQQGFTINSVNIPGINNFNTFNMFVSNMVMELNNYGYSTIANEFDTMEIAYPYTIVKYKGVVSSSMGSNGNSGNAPGNDNNSGPGGNTDSGNSSYTNISSISPDYLIVGKETNITVTLPSGTPPAPPSSVSPNVFTIDDISVSNISRPSQTTINGKINIGITNSLGDKTIIIQFTTPHGTLEYRGTVTFKD